MKLIHPIGVLSICALLLWGAPLSAAEENLLSNGSFEEYTCSAMGCSFGEWSLPLGSGSVETNDKIDGEVSLQVYSTSVNATLDNEVVLSDDYYAPGTPFLITLHYKVLSIPEYSSLALDCYWEPAPGGDENALKKHDAELLQQTVTKTVSSGWERLEILTTKPEGSAGLRIRVAIPKKAKVLFDDFRVEEDESSFASEPYIRVTPNKLSSVTANLGDSVAFTTLHIEQGNLNGTTTFEISGHHREMFHLSATSMSPEQTELDLVVTYVPTQAGNHDAVLNIDNLAHTSLFQYINLQGTCVDPSKNPSVVVEPDELPPFSAVVGQDARDTLTVTSANCIDYVYLRVDHVQGAAFTISSTMLSKNATNKIAVRFAPQEEGEYESTLTISSQNVETQVITLRGTGIKRTEENIDWQTRFQWDESKPVKLLNETFDNISHNKTLLLPGWQNVAAVDERPWWGFDEAKTSPVRGEERYAKATAYQYGKTVRLRGRCSWSLRLWIT